MANLQTRSFSIIAGFSRLRRIPHQRMRDVWSRKVVSHQPRSQMKQEPGSSRSAFPGFQSVCETTHNTIPLTTDRPRRTGPSWRCTKRECPFPSRNREGRWGSHGPSPQTIRCDAAGSQDLTCPSFCPKWIVIPSVRMADLPVSTSNISWEVGGTTHFASVKFSNPHIFGFWECWVTAATGVQKSKTPGRM